MDNADENDELEEVTSVDKVYWRLDAAKDAIAGQTEYLWHNLQQVLRPGIADTLETREARQAYEGALLINYLHELADWMEDHASELQSMRDRIDL